MKEPEPLWLSVWISSLRLPREWMGKHSLSRLVIRTRKR